MKNWLFLPNVLQKVLRWWHIGTSLLLLCLLAQTINGVIEDILLPVWGWWALCTLPVLVLLHLAAWQRINPHKLIHPVAFRGFLALTVGYLVLLLLTFLLSRAAVDRNDYGLEHYYQLSLVILLPLEAVILVACWLIFYKKENVIRPSPQVIQRLAATQSEQATQQGFPARAQCYELIKSNDLPGAFRCLESHFGAENHALILLQGQYAQLEEARQLGTIEAAEAQRTLNRITVAVLQLIGEINA